MGKSLLWDGRSQVCGFERRRATLGGRGQIRQQQDTSLAGARGARKATRETRLKFADGWGSIGGFLGLMAEFFWGVRPLAFFCPVPD